MKSRQRLINAFIEANCITACATCLASIVICAGSTAAWFICAPFASDRLEQQIQRPILPAAGGVVGSLFWVAAGAAITVRWHKDEDDELVSQIPQAPRAEYEQWSQNKPSQQFARFCIGCRYYSNDAFLKPCAVHPGCSLEEAIYCRGFDPFEPE